MKPLSGCEMLAATPFYAGVMPAETSMLSPRNSIDLHTNLRKEKTIIWLTEIQLCNRQDVSIYLADRDMLSQSALNENFKGLIRIDRVA